MDIDMDLVIPNKKLTIFGGAIAVFSTPKHSFNLTQLLRVANKAGLDTHKPFYLLTDEEKDIVFKGYGDYVGIYKFFKTIEKEAAYKIHYRILLNRYRNFTICNTCGGSRLRPEALYVKVGGKTIFDIVKMKISDAYKFFETYSLMNTIKSPKRIMEKYLRA